MLAKLSRKQDQLLEQLNIEGDGKRVFRDADYVMHCIGISGRTLGRRLFSDGDVEQFHREYRSL